MRRRQFLRGATVGALGLTGLAGCGAAGPGVGEGATVVGETATDEGTADETPTMSTAPSIADTETGIPTGAGAGTTTPTEPGSVTTAQSEVSGVAAQTTETTGTPAGQAGATNTIAMVTAGTDYYFDPIGLYVEPGETLTWQNESGAHSSTAYQQGNGLAEVTRIPEGAQAWDSGILSQQGATFEHTFEVTGTYDYFCTPHKTLGMVSRLVVGEPGGPAEGSQPPDGTVPESDVIVEQGAVGWDEFTD